MPSADVGATRARLIASIAERLRQLGGPAGRLARAGIVGLVPMLAGGGDLAAAEPTRSSYIADVVDRHGHDQEVRRRERQLST